MAEVVIHEHKFVVPDYQWIIYIALITSHGHDPIWECAGTESSIWGSVHEKINPLGGLATIEEWNVQDKRFPSLVRLAGTLYIPQDIGINQMLSRDQKSRRTRHDPY